MRLTSPPKHSCEIKKTTSPFNSKLTKHIEQPIHHLHLCSPTKASQKLQANRSSKQNLYAELRNRQQEYVELIKDLHKENKLLKAELGKLHYEESHKLYDSMPLSQNRFINAQPLSNVSNGFSTYRTMSNDKNFNRTLPNFTSPLRMIPQQSEQMRLNKSPFSKRPQDMNNISPDAFRSTQAPITPLCVRPFTNFIPKSPQHKTIDRYSNPSKRPENTISNPSSPHNQSSESSPRKNFQIVHVIETTLKFSASKVARKQAQQHLNPLTSKRHTATKSCKSQVAQNEQTHPQGQQLNSEHQQFNLEKNIDNNPLLNMLKKRLQQQTNFLGSQIESQEIRIEESKCVSFVRTSQYNQNIRYSNEGNDQLESFHVIFPLRRNIFHQFPILNKLRMAQSEIQDQSDTPVCQSHPPTEDLLEINAQKSQQSSRLSDKISKEGQNQSFVEEVYTSKIKPLTIIRMLEENRRNEQQSKSFIDHENVESRQQMELEVHQSQPQYIEVSFSDMQRQTRGHIDDGLEQNQVSDQFYGNTENNSQEQTHHNRYSNRHYCQETEQEVNENENEAEKLHKKQFKRSSQEKHSKFYVEMTKKSSLNQNQNFVTTQSSQKIIVSPCLNSHQAEHETQNTDDGDKMLQRKQSLEFNDEDTMSQQNSRLTHEQKPKLSETSQYQRFYGNKITPNKNSQFISSNQFPMNKTAPNFKQQQQIEFSQFQNSKHIDNHQKFSLTENNWSSDSLRTQRFKKISNMAYL